MNIQIPDRLKRMVDSEAGMVGLRLGRYVARALWNQVRADRAARSDDAAEEAARVKQARAEAEDAFAQSDG